MLYNLDKDKSLKLSCGLTTVAIKQGISRAVSCFNFIRGVIMDYKKYFEKNGCIYGVSKKYGFGKWTGYYRKFTNLDEAEKWLDTEEYDFRTRELCSKTRAREYAIHEI